MALISVGEWVSPGIIVGDGNNLLLFGCLEGGTPVILEDKESSAVPLTGRIYGVFHIEIDENGDWGIPVLLSRFPDAESYSTCYNVLERMHYSGK